MFDAKEKFIDLYRPEYYIRVDDSHPLDFFIGINSKNQKSLKLRGLNDYQNFKGTSCIEVTHLKNEKDFSVVFSLTNDDALSLFYKFCDDLIEETRKIDDINKGYKFVVNRFMLWKKMFVSKKEILSEPEILGLIGELLFLKDFCFVKYGKHEALNGWSGMEPTRKDFSFGEYWYEVKTKSEQSQRIKISSIEQLDSQFPGELVVFDLEKMSPEFNGIRLNELVIDIKKSLENLDDSDVFDYKLSKLQYSYNEDYDKYSYEVKKMTRFSVKEDFPRIQRHKIDYRIDKVQYDIVVNALSNFIIEE